MKDIYQIIEEVFNPQSCDYNIRQEKGCTSFFLKNGLLKNLRWDTWGEYNLLCNTCKHFIKHIGVYFEIGKTSIDFNEQTVFSSLHEFKSQEDFELGMRDFPKEKVKKLYITGKMENLKPLENFSHLELLVVGYGVKLTRFWDMSKTPHVKALHVCGAKNLGDLADLTTTTSLESFGLETITSQIGLSYLETFKKLKFIPTLKYLSISGTMARDKNIDDLISIPNLKELWISPNTYSTEDFAKFEALKFRIFDEYGIYKNGEYESTLGLGRRVFKNEIAKEKYIKKYAMLLKKWSD